MKVQLNNQSITWAQDYLKSNKDVEIITIEKIVETSYSKVYKLEANNEIFFLKNTPETLFKEVETLNLLNRFRCKNIPKIISSNKYLNSFLVISCGEMTIRDLTNIDIKFKLLSQGILNYTNIQRFLENHISELVSINLPDWRLQNFSRLYQNLIEQKTFLLDDGISKLELSQLENLQDRVEYYCKKLSSYNLPETINHCDFQDRNMILDNKTGNVNIIDWGESVIAHPFFSLNGCLWNLGYFYNIKPSHEIYKKIQKECISTWIIDYDEKNLMEAFNIAYKLHGVFAALSYEYLYKSTEKLSKTVQQEHAGALSGCLRTFLNRNNK